MGEREEEEEEIGERKGWREGARKREWVVLEDGCTKGRQQSPSTTHTPHAYTLPPSPKKSDKVKISRSHLFHVTSVGTFMTAFGSSVGTHFFAFSVVITSFDSVVERDGKWREIMSSTRGAFSRLVFFEGGRRRGARLILLKRFPTLLSSFVTLFSHLFLSHLHSIFILPPLPYPYLSNKAA